MRSEGDGTPSNSGGDARRLIDEVGARIVEAERWEADLAAACEHRVSLQAMGAPAAFALLPLNLLRECVEVSASECAAPAHCRSSPSESRDANGRSSAGCAAGRGARSQSIIIV